MNKRNAIPIIIRAAEQYHSNLENQKILFIYGNPTVIKTQLNTNEKILSGLTGYEVAFHKSNFLHLTGVKINKDSIKSSIHFYQKCLDKRLCESDFYLSKDGTTNQKLDIIEQMMNLKKKVTMIGDFTDKGPQLYSEKVAGTVCACIGFVEDSYTKLNVPNTLLKKDIRDVCAKPQQKIYMILSKDYESAKYTTLEKIDKNIEFGKIILPKEIQEKIEISIYG